MVIFRSLPCLFMLLASLATAILRTRTRHDRILAWASVCLASALTLVILICGGTLQEALACLLLSVWLLMEGKAS